MQLLGTPLAFPAGPIGEAVCPQVIDTFLEVWMWQNTLMRHVSSYLDLKRYCHDYLMLNQNHFQPFAVNANP